MKKEKHILFFPLNWGLGHAARCIPIIKYLISEGHKVSIAANGDALNLLKNTFESQINTYAFPQIKIRYGNTKFGTQIKLIKDAFSYFTYYKKEKKHTISLLKKIDDVDLIISDNRYACRSDNVPSVIISHQLKLKLPFLLMIFSFIPNYFIFKRITAFDELWIPDVDDAKNNLSGKLSHPKSKKINAKYIGILSRFTKKTNKVKEKHILAILSGPEPQKSIFEKSLINNLEKLEGYSITIIGGVQNFESNTIKSITLKNSMDIESYLNNAEVVISRAGYTSIMDYVRMEKKAIMVATPGQTEQEYLAKHLQHIPQFVFQKQNKMNIARGIERLRKENIILPEDKNSFIKEIKKYLN